MKHKTVFMRMDPIYIPNIKHRLEKMAMRGWMLEEVNAYSMTFGKCDPQPLHFDILINPENEFKRPDLGPIGEAEELCVADGWRFVLRKSVYAIFANSDANPTPIYSEPRMLVSLIKKRIMNNLFIWGGLCLIFLVVFNTILGTLDYRSVYNPFMIYFFELFLIAILGICFDLLPNLIWFGSTQRKAESGIMVYPDIVYDASSLMQYFMSFAFLIFAINIVCFNPSPYGMTIFEVTGLIVFVILILPSIKKQDGKIGYRLPFESVVRSMAFLIFVAFFALGGFNLIANNAFNTDRALRLSDFDPASIHPTIYSHPSVGLVATKTIDYSEFEDSKYTSTIIVRFYSKFKLEAFWKDRIKELTSKQTALAEWDVQGYYFWDKTAIIIKRGLEVIEIHTEVDLSDMKNVKIVKHRLGISE